MLLLRTEALQCTMCAARRAVMLRKCCRLFEAQRHIEVAQQQLSQDHRQFCNKPGCSSCILPVAAE